MKRTHYSRPLVVKLNRIDPDKVMRYFILLNEKWLYEWNLNSKLNLRNNYARNNNKYCFFSYDSNQVLSKYETQCDIPQKISDLKPKNYNLFYNN